MTSDPAAAPGMAPRAGLSQGKGETDRPSSDLAAFGRPARTAARWPRDEAPQAIRFLDDLGDMSTTITGKAQTVVMRERMIGAHKLTATKTA
jgi:hypothetical protein